MDPLSSKTSISDMLFDVGMMWHAGCLKDEYLRDEMWLCVRILLGQTEYWLSDSDLSLLNTINKEIMNDECV